MTLTADPVTETARAALDPVLGLEPFRDPLRIPPVWDLRGRSKPVRVAARNALVRLHSQLPKTPMWTYEGSFPGPTLVTDRNHRVVVEWANALAGAVPLIGVSTNGTDALVPGHLDADGNLLPGHALMAGVDSLPPWTVVHLHGALTNGWNDGYSTNAISPGASQWAEYPNRQEAAMLWYHDHAMDVTRLSVHAGLAGMYLIHDDNERSLGLPRGRRDIPLMVRDVNLDTDPGSDQPNGRLLYKVRRIDQPLQPGETEPQSVELPVSGPYTMVNGVIWPHLRVDPAWYRFRLLNASNSRLFTLSLVDEDGNDLSSAMRVVGTDGGLLPRPAPVPAAGLPMHCSERFDVLIDFRALRGTRVRLTNAGAGPAAAFAHVMEFQVREHGAPDHFALPTTLNPHYARYTHDAVTAGAEPTLVIPEKHGHVFIALVPPGTAGDQHAAFWELAEIDPPAELEEGTIQVVDAAGTLRTFQRVSKLFHDQNTIFLNSGEFAIWNFIHLGGPAHPMHIHMTEFQTLYRRAITVQGNFDQAAGKTTSPIPTAPAPLPLEEWEKGMKDTFVIPPNTWQAVAGNFTGADGAFMYHCHILDHEDMGMMRPFMVRPAGIAAMDAHGHGHAH
ncbi:MAG: multicopper oxidase domain-containing protein [Microbacterium sp.]|uniref:multicopper oxidase family protein n=1 Tax=Microbacterium sp. TaxID=51671 RepID=UPI0039E48FC3